MQTLVVVGLGGFIGAVFRFLISNWLNEKLLYFSIGTLSVNFLGCFFMGLILSISTYQGIFSKNTELFLMVGILGAFTTMSAFSMETLHLFEQGKILQFGLYLSATIFLSLIAVYLGKYVPLYLNFLQK